MQQKKEKSQYKSFLLDTFKDDGDFSDNCSRTKEALKVTVESLSASLDVIETLPRPQPQNPKLVRSHRVKCSSFSVLF